MPTARRLIADQILWMHSVVEDQQPAVPTAKLGHHLRDGLLLVGLLTKPQLAR
jgi:hypothetical protein